MSYLKVLCGILVVVIGLQSCATRRPLPTVTNYPLDRKVAPADQGEYKIKPGDQLRIKNLNWLSDLVPDPSAVPGNSGSEGLLLSVDVNGQIGIPEIGKLSVAGLSAQRISDTLSVLYKDIIRNPIFETQVTSLRVKVLGAVGIQGIVQLDKEYQSLGEILAKSGGIKYTDAGKTIQIVRGEGTSQRVIQYDFHELADPLIMNQQIFDNDVVYVPPSRDAVRSIRIQRNLAILQPVFTALNITILLINVLR
ncbi:hypothetical protein DYBT9275_04155 [Dyadobacter sp. CECT 9275]|uniref:Polysaccharide export protein N-terminal domain-containing protein n=1 Tax=Dyadobacter helix TaxID=2822344 RepID=A0A916NDF7_9BACT|nr:polysaccharide biosynthesis/export family protein [Dyadobacter sp. CECT 9275]CAG5007920.1 hypothetical protein DYBT9275_04155 [Dyadobacter sp. CECT 9275]